MASSAFLTEKTVDQIAHAVAQQDYIILPNFLPEEMTEQLRKQVANLPDKKFKAAAIGRHDQRQLKQQIRNDQIHWLTNTTVSEQAYLAVMEQCRYQLNQRLFLGLFDYESHFAHYAEGHYYQRHLDAFRGQSNRIVTTIFYLNPDWTNNDGGELLIYSPNTDEVIARILPKFGTMVMFLSDHFPHQVLAAKRDRYSIAGWFRTNNSDSLSIDPIS